MRILTDSEVLLKKTYNDTGKYTGFTTKSDSFYTGSELFNSELLSKNALSDITFFPLGQKQSPFSADDFSILINKTVWVPIDRKIYTGLYRCGDLDKAISSQHTYRGIEVIYILENNHL